MAIMKLLTKITAAQNEDALYYHSARVIFSGSYFFGDYIYIIITADVNKMQIPSYKHSKLKIK